MYESFLKSSLWDIASCSVDDWKKSPNYYKSAVETLWRESATKLL